MRMLLLLSILPGKTAPPSTPPPPPRNSVLLPQCLYTAQWSVSTMYSKHWTCMIFMLYVVYPSVVKGYPPTLRPLIVITGEAAKSVSSHIIVTYGQIWLWLLPMNNTVKMFDFGRSIHLTSMCVKDGAYAGIHKFVSMVIAGDQCLGYDIWTSLGKPFVSRWSSWGSHWHTRRWTYTWGYLHRIFQVSTEHRHTHTVPNITIVCLCSECGYQCVCSLFVHMIIEG